MRLQRSLQADDQIIPSRALSSPARKKIWLVVACGAVLGCAAKRPSAPPAAPGTEACDGELRVNLSSSGGVDLDLYVTDPGHETVYFANPRSGSEGTLEHDVACPLCIGNKVGVYDPEAVAGADRPEGRRLRAYDPLRSKGTRLVHTRGFEPGRDDRSADRRAADDPPAGQDLGQSLAARVTPFLLRFGGWLPQPETMSPDMMLPVPYGIDGAPDGGIWVNQLSVRRIARIDQDSGDYEVFDTPFSAPRRLRFDSKATSGSPASAPASSPGSTRARRSSKPGSCRRTRPARRQYELRHADPVRSENRDVHDLSNAFARHVHAGDRLR